MSMYTLNGKNTPYFTGDPEEDEKKLNRMSLDDLISLSNFKRGGLKKALVNHLKKKNL